MPLQDGPAALSSTNFSLQDSKTKMICDKRRGQCEPAFFSCTSVSSVRNNSCDGTRINATTGVSRKTRNFTEILKALIEAGIGILSLLRVEQNVLSLKQLGKFDSMTSHDTSKRVHEGRNVKRFREMFQIKQEALADMLGDDWSQKKVSIIESKEVVEPDMLKHIASVLKLPVEAFQNFTDEQAINIVSNTFNSHDNSTGNANYPTYNINPIEKWLEALEENRKLYDRLIQDKQDTIAMLEKLIAGKKE
jgi:transcriptional regulator with XRE-family HTH domain